MNRIHARVCAVAACCLLAYSMPVQADQTLELRLGESRTLEIGSVSRVVVNDPKVIDVRPVEGSTIAVEAVGEGQSQLRVWDSKGRRVGYMVVVKGSVDRVDQQEANSGQPASPELTVHRGGAHCDPPKLPDAARAFDQGKRLADEKSFKDAISAFERVRQLEPEAAIALLHLGTTYARFGKTEAGASAYKAFVESCPDHPSAPAIRDVLKAYREAVGEP
ncbi:MAG: pilus assembly protein N-terminal domain-containing protein [Myxococcales bacterium]|jgi:TolA-binding protein